MKYLYGLVAAVLILSLVNSGLKTRMNNALALEIAAARTLELDRVQCTIARRAHVERKYVQVWETIYSSAGVAIGKLKVR